VVNQLKKYMKKVILSCLVILSVIIVNGQVQFGLKAGVNNSTFGGDAADFEGKKSNTGFNFGVLVGIPISSNFVFQPEVMYSGNQGMEYKPTSTSETNYTLNYVNIPLMLKYRSMGFYGEAGPYFGFLTSGKVKQKTATTSTEDDIKKFYEGTDMGVALGTGYIMKSGLGFGVRYNLGIKNIYSNSALAEFKNRYWQVNLIYMFKKQATTTKK
jgi:hypothetical protein